MFFAEGQIRVPLYGVQCGMRKSYDGLEALVRHALGENPLDGSLYTFVNRRDTQLKCLYFDRSRFCIWAKRFAARLIESRKLLFRGH
jgi:transposase